jgi:pimeloyl-ACP methyl ester carboxylesterase
LLRLGYSEQAFNKIIVPTLVLCGDREERPGVEAYLALTRELPQGELKVVPNLDHDYPISNVDSFTNTITDFFLQGDLCQLYNHIA